MLSNKRGARPREPERPKEYLLCTAPSTYTRPRPARYRAPTAMRNPLPFFQHCGRDWLVATTGLPLAAQGAIMRLLSYEWSEGPFAAAAVRAILNTDELEAARLWAEVAPTWFPELPEHAGYHANPELEAKRREAEEYRERQRQLGLVGAKKRWTRHR